MESIHGVDVGWLHHTRKASGKGELSPPSPSLTHDANKHSYFPGPVTPPALSTPVSDNTTALPITPSSNPNAKTQSKRPGLLNRASSEKVSGDGKGPPRRSSWISNISNKFSTSQATPERPGVQSTQSAPSQYGSSPTPTSNVPAQSPEASEPSESMSSTPKGSSFFSSLTRKLSSNSQVGSTPKVNGKGGLCQRRVLNVDPNRERCLVPEMDESRLRKVSFCVDVEIAGGPRYNDDDEDDEDDQEKKRRNKAAKLKEKAEGEALKHPEAIKEAKDEGEEQKLEGKNKPLPNPKDIPNGKDVGEEDEDLTSPPTAGEKVMSDKKKEKKKRSEEERKERKEKRRRRAEENGSIPVELSLDDGVATGLDSDTISFSFPDRKPLPNLSTGSTPDPKRDRPTTDPVRIYRRCCQLRETPILKRITEQLMSPTCCVPYEPGVVNCLDLTGSRLQLADMITLGDWLAVVPVKRLLLEDADLSDEGLRCILAGLLAAKKPEPTKRKSTSPKHRQGMQPRPHRERSGVVEKLTIKNNPRITRNGWKHVSLFLYMCRSIKAFDASMIQFPDSLPPSAHNTPAKSPQSPPAGQDTDAAETFFKCLSQRFGGSKLEELILSECGMTAPQIRKIVDGAIICGINRLGFAGNHLDEEGLEAVIHYLKSGVCGGLDIGGNDLRGKLDAIAEALNNRAGVTCWGLSLADCNLDTSSVKPLFPALVKLPNFRFLDLSHNPDLCGQDNGTISLLRRYIGQMKYLKRIHLAAVNMSPKQAIALADVLPEGPELAHMNILENPQLTALANATDEANQEEACALYASYMAAVRVSTTLICIDIDVPSSDNSEVVKALAKQIVAYSLRNMERFAVVEATGSSAASDAAASLTQPHGGEQQLKEITVPDVLMHLVGHVEGNSENHDNDDPAPDTDYLVGGTGVVKALQYVLGEKADDLRRSSLPSSPISGSRTPRDRPSSSAGFDEQQQVKAKKMSKNLLDSARKIRSRLQPAIAKESNAGDEMAMRRLLFLDSTLSSMIQRFEEEYPETRIVPPSPKQAPSLASSTTEQSAPLSITTQGTEFTNKSDDEDEFDDLSSFRPAVSRHNSDVSLASRALAIEEGHLHRLGQRMRRSIVDSPSALSAADDPSATAPWKADEERRLKALAQKVEAITGPELKDLVESNGWEVAMGKVGANMHDLRALQEADPQAWEDFKESQMKARMNLAQDARSK
ncbi:hypothetical protein M409DRAFT_62774 [Zasmidium cellare ATCC 36951]|uniref:RNI-like protein n=1 Tax=Zasmidium cellare ATCC 36951 TaxID=1080233 RepID=A0A6A6D189_ZASCE|nr:uncharacterized protein M409DRAFT_62774 [Zasmidium cellare ATCC 36951]KAF2173194.1 hypothetical protein M409DRAFT_62774 [Zasmidium cellare ATCC 36951]